MRSSRSGVVQDGKLLAQGEDLKVQRRPAPNCSGQGMEQGNEDGSHARDARLECPKKSMILRLTAFFAGTGASRARPQVTCWRASSVADRLLLAFSCRRRGLIPRQWQRRCRIRSRPPDCNHHRLHCNITVVLCASLLQTGRPCPDGPGAVPPCRPD